MKNFFLFLILFLIPSSAFAEPSFWLKTSDDCGPYISKLSSPKVEKADIINNPIYPHGIKIDQWYFIYEDIEQPKAEQLTASGHAMCIFFDNPEDGMRDKIDRLAKQIGTYKIDEKSAFDTLKNLIGK